MYIKEKDKGTGEFRKTSMPHEKILEYYDNYKYRIYEDKEWCIQYWEKDDYLVVIHFCPPVKECIFSDGTHTAVTNRRLRDITGSDVTFAGRCDSCNKAIPSKVIQNAKMSIKLREYNNDGGSQDRQQGT